MSLGPSSVEMTSYHTKTPNYDFICLPLTSDPSCQQTPGPTLLAMGDQKFRANFPRNSSSFASQAASEPGSLAPDHPSQHQGSPVGLGPLAGEGTGGPRSGLSSGRTSPSSETPRGGDLPQASEACPAPVAAERSLAAEGEQQPPADSSTAAHITASPELAPFPLALNKAQQSAAALSPSAERTPSSVEALSGGSRFTLACGETAAPLLEHPSPASATASKENGLKGEGSPLSPSSQEEDGLGAQQEGEEERRGTELPRLRVEERRDWEAWLRPCSMDSGKGGEDESQGGRRGEEADPAQQHGQPSPDHWEDHEEGGGEGRMGWSGQQGNAGADEMGRRDHASSLAFFEGTPWEEGEALEGEEWGQAEGVAANGGNGRVAGWADEAAREEQGQEQWGEEAEEEDPQEAAIAASLQQAAEGCGMMVMRDYSLHVRLAEESSGAGKQCPLAVPPSYDGERGLNSSLPAPPPPPQPSLPATPAFRPSPLLPPLAEWLSPVRRRARPVAVAGVALPLPHSVDWAAGAGAAAGLQGGGGRPGECLAGPAGAVCAAGSGSGGGWGSTWRTPGPSYAGESEKEILPATELPQQQRQWALEGEQQGPAFAARRTQSSLPPSLLGMPPLELGGSRDTGFLGSREPQARRLTHAHTGPEAEQPYEFAGSLKSSAASSRRTAMAASACPAPLSATGLGPSAAAEALQWPASLEPPSQLPAPSRPAALPQLPASDQVGSRVPPTPAPQRTSTLPPHWYESYGVSRVAVQEGVLASSPAPVPHSHAEASVGLPWRHLAPPHEAQPAAAAPSAAQQPLLEAPPLLRSGQGGLAVGGSAAQRDGALEATLQRLPLVGAPESLQAARGPGTQSVAVSPCGACAPLVARLSQQLLQAQAGKAVVERQLASAVVYLRALLHQQQPPPPSPSSPQSPPPPPPPPPPIRHLPLPHAPALVPSRHMSPGVVTPAVAGVLPSRSPPAEVQPMRATAPSSPGASSSVSPGVLPSAGDRKAWERSAMLQPSPGFPPWPGPAPPTGTAAAWQPALPLEPARSLPPLTPPPAGWGHGEHSSSSSGGGMSGSSSSSSIQLELEAWGDDRAGAFCKALPAVAAHPGKAPLHERERALHALRPAVAAPPRPAIPPDLSSLHPLPSTAAFAAPTAPALAPSTPLLPPRTADAPVPLLRSPLPDSAPGPSSLPLPHQRDAAPSSALLQKPSLRPPGSPVPSVAASRAGAAAETRAAAGAGDAGTGDTPAARAAAALGTLATPSDAAGVAPAASSVPAGALAPAGAAAGAAAAPSSPGAATVVTTAGLLQAIEAEGTALLIPSPVGAAAADRAAARKAAAGGKKLAPEAVAVAASGPSSPPPAGHLVATVAPAPGAAVQQAVPLAAALPQLPVKLPKSISVRANQLPGAAGKVTPGAAKAAEAPSPGAGGPGPRSKPQAAPDASASAERAAKARLVRASGPTAPKQPPATSSSDTAEFSEGPGGGARGARAAAGIRGRQAAGPSGSTKEGGARKAVQPGSSSSSALLPCSPADAPVPQQHPLQAAGPAATPPSAAPASPARISAGRSLRQAILGASRAAAGTAERLTTAEQAAQAAQAAAAALAAGTGGQGATPPRDRDSAGSKRLAAEAAASVTSGAALLAAQALPAVGTCAATSEAPSTAQGGRGTGEQAATGAAAPASAGEAGGQDSEREGGREGGSQGAQESGERASWEDVLLEGMGESEGGRIGGRGEEGQRANGGAAAVASVSAVAAGTGGKGKREAGSRGGGKKEQRRKRNEGASQESSAAASDHSSSRDKRGRSSVGAAASASGSAAGASSPAGSPRGASSSASSSCRPSQGSHGHARLGSSSDTSHGAPTGSWNSAGGSSMEVFDQGTYKTELCNKWETMGTCPYGPRCQFAHGVDELRPVLRHPRYKTELCRMIAAGKSCPYGHRCHFRHSLSPEERDFLFMF